jgi:predicted ferric reductase
MGERMDFRPSQFVYLVVNKKGITPEAHPYSIACGYNLGGKFKLGIKAVGDHTRSLNALEKGDLVSVFGPYGRFSDKFLSGERDCVLIGGGVGITPHIGMWHVALYSEERLGRYAVPERLQSLHPEIIRTWKSPRVTLFYICHTKDQASFDEDIRGEVLLSHFHGFEALEARGHYYELYLSSEKGLFSAKYANKRVSGGVLDKNIFLCGPSPMVEALIKQFRMIGVPEEQIILEDFNLF